ncbi:adenosine deaminase-like protein [Sitodiplosis mosellana]|uniref:adenosine deaminase-like protein n=1 Tax=Sitodiplosis mosellana TaxID=263140 RepID=UPI002444F4D9|nr:adenosine deaminase-like protein [Sitodiplosis mosellana]
MKPNKEIFIEQLPKVELHAHINGSLSNETLCKLSQLKYGTDAKHTEKYHLLTKMDLIDAFEKFKYAHELTDTPEAVALATECVIRDFSDDNVVYVELRSTPRSTMKMTKDEYIMAVIDTILKMKSQLPSILVKLIVSINRRESIESAEENGSLASKYAKLHPNIVCGVDLSGDPASKKFSDFEPILAKARETGLKLALHCGEIDDQDEISAMLKFGMHRLGHGTFIKGENEEILLKNNEIALECCLTSNLLCGVVPTYSDHHFWRFYKNGHPVVICTDDFGVFSTSLSKELQIASDTFNLSSDDLIKLSRGAIDCSFASDDEKPIVHGKIDSFAKDAIGF